MLEIKRISTWEQALIDFIDSKRDEPFVYGTHDCCTFIAGAVEAMTGLDPMSEFRDSYRSLASSVRALREIGHGDLEATIDAKFPIVSISNAQRGDLAFFDGSLGVIMDGWAWFVSDNGLDRVPRSFWIKAWSVGRG